MPSEQQNEARQRVNIPPRNKATSILQPFPPIPVKIGVIEKIKITLAIRSIIMKKTSWKSTLGGILLALSPASKSLPDQWHWVGEAMIALGGLLLSQGRDNNVTSEEAGAK